MADVSKIRVRGTDYNIKDATARNAKAFGTVTVGTTSIAADSASDTLTLAAGANITLTPDAANDKVTVAAKDTTYSTFSRSAAGLVPAAPSGSGTAKYLREDGSWTAPPDTNTTYSSLKNPFALTVSLNGTKTEYDGSAAKSVTVTPDAIGAATKSELSALVIAEEQTVEGNGNAYVYVQKKTDYVLVSASAITLDNHYICTGFSLRNDTHIYTVFLNETLAQSSKVAMFFVWVKAVPIWET